MTKQYFQSTKEIDNKGSEINKGRGGVGEGTMDLYLELDKLTGLIGAL